MQNFFLNFKNSANTIAWSVLVAFQFLPTYYSSYAILLVLGCLVINHNKIQWKVGLMNPLVISWAIYLVWLGLSFFWSSNMNEAISVLTTQFLLVLIPLLYFLNPLDKGGLQWVGRFWYTAAFVSIFWAISVNFNQVYELHLTKAEEILPLFFYTALAQSIMHPGYFSLLIIGAGFWLFVDGDVPKLIKWFGLTIIIVFLLMLSARMTLLALALTIFGLIISNTLRRGKLVLMKVILSILAALVIIWFFLPDVTRSRFLELTEGFDYNIETYSLEDYNSITIRLALWESAGEIIAQQPWFGVGVGDYKDALWATHARNGIVDAIDDSLNSHNQFVENALIAGIPWAIGLFLVLIYFLRLGIKQSNWYFVAFIAFMFLCFQSETVLFWHRGILFFSLFAVLLYHRELTYQNKDS